MMVYCSNSIGSICCGFVVQFVVALILYANDYWARQLYNNISMLFLLPVKDGKLSTGVITIFNASCYG